MVTQAIPTPGQYSPAREEPKKKQEEASEQVTRKAGALFSPEGVLMLTWGIILDGLTFISFLFIIFGGIGLIFAKIVYFIGLFSVGVWAFFRSGTMSGIGSFKDRITRGLKGLKEGFLKRQWKKLLLRFVPGLGDAIPGVWTHTIYSELKSEV